MYMNCKTFYDSEHSLFVNVLSGVTDGMCLAASAKAPPKGLKGVLLR